MELKKLKISENKTQLFEKMGIHCVEDLLHHYPFRYEEREMKPFREWQTGENVCFEAMILSCASVNRYAYKRSVTRFKVMYEEEELRITLFNRPWTSGFVPEKRISVFGRYEGNNNVIAMNYNFQPIKEQLGIIPVYNTIEGLSQKDFISNMRKALSICQLPQFVPSFYCEKYHLISLRDALIQIHIPKDKEHLKQSLRALKYEEFLRFQLQMQIAKKSNVQKKGIGKQFDEKKIGQMIHSLPYELSEGQKQAIQEVLSDLKAEHVMYRLVQGDVGCGKTTVAAIAMYACILSKRQAVMMAPTEILAKQHYQNLSQMFERFSIRIGILYSSMKQKERQHMLHQIAQGEVDLIVGTHSLFQEEVVYHNLGLVIADEQHRFGVEQRRKLLEKGDKVDFLLMSATPIPRTLAVSLYGDMEVSTITTLPKGRKKVNTVYVKEDSLRSVLPEILSNLDQGMQCYVVAPAIEAKEEYRMRNVFELYENMNQVLGKKYRIALLHGKMSSDEKDCIMEQFLHREFSILITTTVIEVGVDVKNANIMVIYDAHRFGMSQIHQLRGRVGRGNQQGWCYLLSASKDPDAIQRLSVMESTNDGFAIAKADLLMRGPGDLLGVRQSGAASFLLGDVVKDQAILEVTRKDAEEILLHIDEYEEIKAFVEKKDYTSYLD